jgi:hypothetical protein
MATSVSAKVPPRRRQASISAADLVCEPAEEHEREQVAEHVDRRHTPSLAEQFPIGFGLASAAVFAAAAGTSWLFAARLLSGLATGLAAGAATAWIAELYSGRTAGAAARIASAANFFGCAAGPLLAGLLAQFAFWPLVTDTLADLDRTLEIDRTMQSESA